MKFSNRQIGILYELINSDTYRSYSFLCDKFSVSEKTIRIDIAYLNDSLKDDVAISLKKGKGFFLDCSNEKKEELLLNFSYRYKDSEEAIYEYSKRDLTILYMLSKGSIRTEDLSLTLGINRKKISNILQDMRKTFDLYGVSLKSRPYKGISMEGNELNIRNCIIDQVAIMSISDIENLFYDDSKVFKIDRRELQEIRSICMETIENDNLNISSYQLSTLVSTIVLSIRRILSHHYVCFNLEQVELIKDFVHADTANKLIRKIESYYRIELPENEKWFFVMALMLSQNFDEKEYLCSFTDSIRQKVYDITQTTIAALLKNGILMQDEALILAETIYSTVFEAYVASFVGWINNQSYTVFEKINNYSSLSVTLGLMLYETLNNELGSEVGFYFLNHLILKIYTKIRTIRRSVYMNKIVIYTPFYTESCLSLTERIAYHCSRYINEVKVVTISDMNSDKLSQYDLLLYFEDFPPENVPQGLDSLKISFFLDQEDRVKLYSKLAPMNKLYQTIFADISWHSVIEKQETTANYDSAIQWIRKYIEDDKKLNNQLNMIYCHKLLVLKEVFHIVLFTDKDDLKITKVFQLNESKQIENAKIKKVMVHIVNCKNDLSSIKTAEALIRRLGNLPLNNSNQISEEEYNQLIFFDNKIQN